jgi:hypothetical protein
MRLSSAALSLLLIGLVAMPVNAQDLNSEVAELRQLVAEMREDYETRISDLEDRLARTERLASGAREVAEQTAIDQSAGSSAPNAFNPALGAVLTGYYADVDTGSSGFALGEAEINLKASVDARYFGNLTVGVHEDDGDTEVHIEEAWLQTTDLPAGLSITGGRLFSAAGYLNGFHFHSDDFVDRPLPYQAFLGGRYSVDGLQARWVAPTSLLFELGTELNWGGAFPATSNGESSPGAWTLFAKLGGDIGDSNSWQLGVSHIQADAIERSAGHGHEGEAAAETFTGDSDLTAVDFVWKWAPLGNTNVRNFKLQGEYFSRSEKGLFDGIDYDGDQTGWYLQGAWQFAPLWRVGMRYDTVDADLEDPGRSSTRSSAMLDWSPSEFSRLRLQYTNDRVLPETDHQWYLQYIMSIGAHGAHQF